MNKDKKVLYLISVILFAALLVILFVDAESSKIVTACLLLLATPTVCLLIRKRGSLSINKREVLLLSTVISVIYVVLLQLTGIFFGFHKNPYFVNSKIFLFTILPIATIIITAEVIRFVLLNQKNTFVNVLAFFICVFAELLSFSSIAGITNFNHFMDFVTILCCCGPAI